MVGTLQTGLRGAETKIHHRTSLMSLRSKTTYYSIDDTSDFATGAVLLRKAARVQPVAFYSRNMTATKLNYDMHDREMLVNVSAFKQWRKYLEGAENPILVFAYHKILEYFTPTKVLNCHSARWAQELGANDFKIVYHSGNLNCKLDVLCRQPGY
jgi:hypothetical protein